MAGEGLIKRQKLEAGGYTPEEVQQWETDTRAKLIRGGFSGKEADEYFGVMEPDLSATKEVFQRNLEAAAVPKEDSSTPPKPTDALPIPAPQEVPDPTRNLNAPPDKKLMSGIPGLAPAFPAGQQAKPAETFWEHVQAGWGMSIPGLVKNGGLPKNYVPEDSPRLYRIASQVTQLAADYPTMVLGGALGKLAGTYIGAAGGAVTPVPGGAEVGGAIGGAAGSGFGSFALPAAIRGTLISHYKDGSIKDFNDFYDRAAAIFVDSIKQGAVGVATVGAGKAASVGLKGASPLVRTSGEIVAEIGAMTMVGDALEGQVPSWSHFVDAAIVLGVTRAVRPMASKLADIYEKTGVTPDRVVEMAVTDPTLKADLLSTSPEIPKALEPMLDPQAVKSKFEKVELPEKLAKDVTGGGDAEPVEMKMEPLPAPLEKPLYAYEPMDVSKPAGKMFFHGTKSDLTKLSDADVYGKSSVKNLYGEGLYLTDNPTVAESYAQNKGKGPVGKVLAAQLADVKLLDLEKPLPESALKILNDTIAQYSDAKMSPEAKGTFVYDRLKEAMSDAGITESEAVEVFQDLNARLSAVGFDGLRHEGGGRVRANLGKHNVVILFEDVGVASNGELVGRQLKNKITDADYSSVLSKLKEERGSVSNEPTKVSDKPKTELDLARESILSRIESRPEYDREGLSWDRFYENVFDRFDPVKRFVQQLTGGEKLPASEDPYVLFRTAVDYAGKAVHFLKYGALDFKTLERTKEASESLRDILEPFKKERPEFTAFIAAKRALELEGMKNERGDKIDSGMNVEDARVVYEGGKAKYDAAAQKLVDYQNSVLKYLVDSERLSPKAYEMMTAGHKAYVPWHRILEDGSAGGGKKTSPTGNPIKRIFGSEKKVVDPIESIIRNTFEYVRLAENNRALMGLVKLAEAKAEEGISPLIQRVKLPTKAINVKAEEVAQFLVSQGVSGYDADALAKEFTIYRRGSVHLADNEFVIWRKGQMELYQVADEGVARAFRALEGDAPSMNLLMKMLAVPAATTRAMIALTPDFIFRNFIRDQVTAATFAESRHLPAIHTLWALGDVFTSTNFSQKVLGIKTTEAYRNWLKSGGGTSSFVSVDKEYISENIFDLNKATGFFDSAYNVARHPIEHIRIMSELIENSTRVAEFKRVTKGKTDIESITKGGFASREVTVDFQRIGAKMRAMNQITAFYNVGLQGLDRSARAFKENPQEFLARGFAWITLPTLYLYYHNYGDQRLDEIPRWQRDNFWIVTTDKWEDVREEDMPFLDGKPSYLKRKVDGKWQINNGAIYRIPKPAELGILFGTLPERVLDAFFKENPHAFKEFGDSVAEGLLPNYTPQSAVVLEHLVNKSFFTKNKIVPAPLEGVAGNYQYTEYTTETAKVMGSLLSKLPLGIGDIGGKAKLSSPLVVEQYVRAFTGNVGMYVLQAADQGLVAAEEKLRKDAQSGDENAVKRLEKFERMVSVVPNRPDPTLADIPFVKAFVARYPSANSTSIRDFYDNFEKADTIWNTVEHLKAIGDYKNMSHEMRKWSERPDTIVRLEGMKDALTNLSQTIRRVVLNPEMSKHDKRQLIDNMYYGMIEIARSGNKAFEDIKKQVDNQQTVGE